MGKVILLNLEITKKQQKFINTSADEVLYGGAAGGGKSYAQLIDALLYALKYKGSKQLILRRTFPDLERSLILVHLNFFPSKIYQYNQSKHRGVFKNGSFIEFGYCDNERDIYQYQGAEYDVIRFDELTHFTETMYLYLFSRVRGANTFPKGIKSSTNPGGVGHTWVKARFIDIGPANVPQSCAVGCKGEYSTRLFIPSRIQDNPFLMQNDPNYLKRLENMGGNEKKALLYGEWDLNDGQFFYEFTRERHICTPLEIPKSMRLYVSLDYGMDMLAALWIAVDSEGRATIYRELYEGRDNKKGESGRGHIISDAAKRILQESTNEKIYAYLAPPDLWSRRQETGKSAAEIFAQNGVRLTKTSNDRAAGWLAVREYLKTEKTQSGDFAPRIKIFNTCVNIIRCLGALQYDSKNYSDAANEPHEITHAPDALRGFCIYRAYPAAETQNEHDHLRENFNLEIKIRHALGAGDSVNII